MSIFGDVGGFIARVGSWFDSKGSDQSALPNSYNQGQALMATQHGAVGPTTGRFGTVPLGANPDVSFGKLWNEAEAIKVDGHTPFKDLVQYNPVNETLTHMATVYGGGLHGLSTIWNVGDISEANGGSQWRPFHSIQDWRNAWNATSSSGNPNQPGGALYKPGFGQSVITGAAAAPVWDPLSFFGHGPKGGVFGKTKDNQVYLQQAEQLNDSLGGKIAGGAIDFAATAAVDPLKGVAAVRKVAGEANTLPFGQAEDVALEGQKYAGADKRSLGQRMVGLLDTSNDERAARQQDMIASTRHETRPAMISAMLHGPLTRTQNTAPIVDLFAQAGELSDPIKQDLVKHDILANAGGSPEALQRLVQTVPHIARAMERISSAPEGFGNLDVLTNATAMAAAYDQATYGSPLDSLDDLFTKPGQLDVMNHMGTSFRNMAENIPTNNQAELNAYADRLDKIHQDLNLLHSQGQALTDNPLEGVGMTALQKWKSGTQSKLVRDFYFQPSPTSATVRVLHLVAGQAARGKIDLRDADRGGNALLDWMSKARFSDGNGIDQANEPLFTVAERMMHMDAYRALPTQEARGLYVKRLNNLVVQKVGDRYGRTPEQIDTIMQGNDAVSVQAKQYMATKLNSDYLAGSDTSIIPDPVSASHTSANTAILKDQIDNTETLHDVQHIERQVRQNVYGVNLSDRMANAAVGFGHSINWANNIWRLVTLARPGLMIRTQLDSQGRSAAIMGGQGYMQSALTAIGRAGISIAHVAPESRYTVATAMAADLAHADDLMETAADMRRYAQAADDNVAMGHYDYHGLMIPTDQLRARAGDLEATATQLKDTKYLIKKFSAGNRPINFVDKQGNTYTTRTEESEAVRQDYQKGGALLPGGETYGDGLMHGWGENGGAPQNYRDMGNVIFANRQAKLFRDANNWTSVASDDPYWAEKYNQTVQQLKRSHTVRQIIKLADLQGPDLWEQLAKDPLVTDEWKAGGMADELKSEWINRMIHYTEWNLRTPELRQAALTQAQLSKDAIHKMVNEFDGADTTLPDKFEIHGPAVGTNPGMVQGMREAGFVGSAQALAHGSIGLFGDKPDILWARHPVFVNRHATHWKQIISDMADQAEANGEAGVSLDNQALAQRVATRKAIADTKQLFYDTARYTGLHAAGRFVSPFYGAWEDAAMSWSRLVYDDPAVAGQFYRLWYAPDQAGLVVDQNGKRILPGDTTAQQKFFVLPLPKAVRGITGGSVAGMSAEQFLLRKDSLNSIFQGSVPWLPGFGPSVQIPASEILGRVMPGIGDSSNPVIQSLFLNGVPKRSPGAAGVFKDVFDQAQPAWIRHFAAAFSPSSSDYTDGVASSAYSQIINARMAGKPVPPLSVVMQNAIKQAKSGIYIKALSLGLFGMSGETQSVADYYRLQYNALEQQSQQIQAAGKTVAQVFAQEHPEAAGLDFKVSKSETGVNATVPAFNRERQYAKEITANPQYGWFYVGADNLVNANNPFSQSIYNAQYSRQIPGETVTERHPQDARSIVSNALAEDGWLQYQTFQLSVNQQLQSWGLSNINQSGAANLLQAKRTFVAQLKAENPAWATAYDQQDNGKLERFISVAQQAFQDPNLAKRSDISYLAAYLNARSEALTALQDQAGVRSLAANGADGARKQLLELGNQFAATDLGFQQIWTRELQREVESSTDASAKTGAG